MNIPNQQSSGFSLPNRIKKIRKNIVVENLINIIETIYNGSMDVYQSLFGLENGSDEDINEWQNIVPDNSINSISNKKLQKFALIVSDHSKDLLGLNDLLLERGYESVLLNDSDSDEGPLSRPSSRNSGLNSNRSSNSDFSTDIVVEEHKVLNNMVNMDGNLFIHSFRDLELDFLKSSFKEKCKVFVFYPKKLYLRYELSENNNEILENPEDISGTDMIVISSDPVNFNNINDAFLNVYRNTKGKVPLKVMVRLMKNIIPKDKTFSVEYSRKGACNRLVSEYITGNY
jgi:hypothetical protein